jgi:3-dehydrosphinganine reductase
MQLQGTGVKLSVAYPPDTDTPGYALEKLSKPGLCNAVNDAVGSDLYAAEKVAKKLVKQLERGDYHLTTPDLGSNILISSMTSLAPKSLPSLVGIVISPIVQIASSVVGGIADRAARKYNVQKGYPEEAS